MWPLLGMLAAEALPAVAEALPMVASTVGRAAAGGALRMGASEGVAGMVGKGAQAGTRMAPSAMKGLGSGGSNAPSEEGPSPRESRGSAFSMGAGLVPSSGYHPFSFDAGFQA